MTTAAPEKNSPWSTNTSVDDTKTAKAATGANHRTTPTTHDAERAALRRQLAVQRGVADQRRRAVGDASPCPIREPVRDRPAEHPADHAGGQHDERERHREEGESDERAHGDPHQGDVVERTLRDPGTACTTMAITAGATPANSEATTSVLAEA